MLPNKNGVTCSSLSLSASSFEFILPLCLSRKELGYLVHPTSKYKAPSTCWDQLDKITLWDSYQISALNKLFFWIKHRGSSIATLLPASSQCACVVKVPDSRRGLMFLVKLSRIMFFSCKPQLKIEYRVMVQSNGCYMEALSR